METGEQILLLFVFPRELRGLSSCHFLILSRSTFASSALAELLQLQVCNSQFFPHFSTTFKQQQEIQRERESENSSNCHSVCTLRVEENFETNYARGPSPVVAWSKCHAFFCSLLLFSFIPECHNCGRVVRAVEKKSNEAKSQLG